jgi:Na+/proline symporter
MIAGFAVLAISSYKELNLYVGGKLDFEQILPAAMLQFVPAGLLGLVLAGLLAAFMSTFAGTLNAAQAYATNDLYLKYINPEATNKQIKYSNYVIGLSIVSLSILLGFFITNINQILQILVSAFFGSYVGSNVLKWYWWRFNSYGYFWGMMGGILAGFIPVIFPGITEWLFPTFAPDIRVLLFFPFILLFSTIGCIVGTYAYPPTEEKVLHEFYKTVKPWGFWNPVFEKIHATDSTFTKNKRFWKDMFNVFIGIIWQVSLVLLPIYLVIHEFGYMFIVIGIITITSVILKYTWWNKLDEI